MSIRRNTFTAAFCASLLAAASLSTAQSFSEIHADRAVKPVSMTGGAVLSSGKAAAGDDFTVDHPHKGGYVLHFKSGLFAGLPMFSCTPIGENATPPICIA